MVYRRCGKRILDFASSILALVVLLPFLVLIGVAVRLKCGAGVLFRQRRPGLNGKPFILLKFRTMTNECDEQGKLFPDEQRLMGLGRFLRRTSLDELPELINVVKGEMSLVGPRPLLIEYLDCYSPEQGRRHEVRPGITGWAQINGRNALSWEEKFELDVWYVDHMSLILDAKILALTVWTIVKRDGISQPGHATMPVFKGTAQNERE